MENDKNAEMAFSKWSPDLELTPAILEKVFSTALRFGGDLAELFFENTESSRITYEDQKTDRVIQGCDAGVGLRIFKNGKTVYGYTTDRSIEDPGEPFVRLAFNLSQALQNSAENKTGETFGKCSSIDWWKSNQNNAEILSYRIQKSPRSLTLFQKVEIAKAAEQGARAELEGKTGDLKNRLTIKQISSVFLDSIRRTLIISSDGRVATQEKVYLQIYVQVVAEQAGRIETAYESKGGFVGLEFFEKTSPGSIGIQAACRVYTLLNAKAAPAGTFPIVISSEAGGTMIHEAVGHGLEADLACNGLSVYGGKVGQKVASDKITVIDDGTWPALRGSYAFDDEGQPSQKTVLIEKGVLKGYLVDRLSAFKFDQPSSGNGRRESFRSKPIVRMTNTYIAPGTDDPNQILKDTTHGIFVKAMGGGQVNTVTGDFVFAVTEGYLIHNGKLGDPIRGATLVGNGPKVLLEVDRVGTDLGFSTGTCGKDGQGAPVTDAQPTLRIPSLTVGGEVPASTYWPELA